MLWCGRLASGRWEAKSQLAHRRSKIEYQTFRPWSTTYTELGQGSVRAVPCPRGHATPHGLVPTPGREGGREGSSLPR